MTTREKEYVPRLNVEIRQDQFEQLQQLLEHGLRKPIFEVLIDDLIRWLKLDKGFVVGAILNKRVGLKELCGLDAEDGNNS